MTAQADTRGGPGEPHAGLDRGGTLLRRAGLQELIASGAPLAEVLTEITASVERCEPSLIGCIVLLDPATSTLHPGAGPLLPSEYLAAIDGVVIGPNIGACGSAAWSGELTISQDISTDPRWAPIRDFALACGLRHCWSISAAGCAAR